ncbi:hypothetical protein VPH35_001289 [Triticum aestivum]
MASSASSSISPAALPATTPPPPPSPCPPPDPDPDPLLAAAVGGLEAPVPCSLGCSELLLPPPPPRLPANSTPKLVAEAPVTSSEQPWVEVGGQHRSRMEKAPAPSPRKGVGVSLAFKRRTYGRCFRCLASEHFVADCRDPIRCLGCGISGHREREFPTRLPAKQASTPHSPSHAAFPRRSPDAPPYHAPPPYPPHRSWASVAASPAVLVQEAPCSNSGSPCSGLADLVKSSIAAELGLLQPHFAAQIEALHTEVQALAATRTEEVIQPLRDMAFALQGWAVQVSSLLERLEAISGSVVSSPAINGSPEVQEDGTLRIGGGPFSSSAPMDPPPPWCEHEEPAPLVVACAKGVSETSVVGCSSEVLATMALPADVLPTLDVVLHKMMIQHEEEQGTVEEIVKMSKDMEQIEVVLPTAATL